MPAFRLPLLLLGISLLPLCAGESAAGFADFRKLAAIDTSAAAPAWTVQTGSFELPSKVLRNPVVTCHYATATTAAGKPAPRAGDVVFYFTFPTEAEFQKGAPFKRLAAESGFTVMGIFFAQHAEKDMDVHDRSNYMWAQSGAFDTYLEARKILVERLGIAARPVFCIGNSGGAMASQHFAEEHPALCDGAAIMAGHAFIQRRGARCPMLILSTLGDGSPVANLGLAQLCDLRGQPCLQAFTQPEWGRRPWPGHLFWHCMTPLAFDLSTHYLEGLADLRAGNQGTIPAVEAWPVACSRSDPRKVVAPAKGWQGKLAEDDVLFLPSQRAYADWIRNPTPSTTMSANGVTADVAVPQPMLPPQAIAVFSWHRIQDPPATPSPDARIDPAAELKWDLRQFLDRGAFAIGVEGAARQAAAVLGTLAQRYPESSTLPLIALLRAPRPEDLAGITDLPRLAKVVLVFDPLADQAPFIAPTTALLERGIPIQVVMATTTPKAPDSPLALIQGRKAACSVTAIDATDPKTGTPKTELWIHAELMQRACDSIPRPVAEPQAKPKAPIKPPEKAKTGSKKS